MKIVEHKHSPIKHAKHWEWCHVKDKPILIGCCEKEIELKGLPKLVVEEFEETGEYHHLRFHLPHKLLNSVFGDDWFALKAEGFARFFGTPTFLIGQTCVVFVWILANVLGFVKFDVYPFILLNLAFSLQAAYAAPLILLAQTRQSARDKAHTEADARHREAIAKASEDREILANKQATQMVELLQQNTNLTELTQQLSKSVETLTIELHKKFDGQFGGKSNG